MYSKKMFVYYAKTSIFIHFSGVSLDIIICGNLKIYDPE